MGMAQFADLPPEQLVLIASFCSPQSLLRLRATSRGLKEVASEASRSHHVTLRWPTPPLIRGQWFYGEVTVSHVSSHVDAMRIRDGLSTAKAVHLDHILLLSPEDVAPLEVWPSLRSVSCCNPISDLAGRVLASCSSLAWLTVPSLTESQAASLAACATLASVCIYSARNLTDAAVASLATCPSLSSVSFGESGYESCSELTDAAAASLSGCPLLRSATFERCPRLTSAAAAYLAAGPALSSVSFVECSGLTDAAGASLAACPSLRAASFVGCSRITDAGVAALAESPPLRLVRFGDCAGLTRASLWSLAGSRSLRAVHFSYVISKGSEMRAREAFDLVGLHGSTAFTPQGGGRPAGKVVCRHVWGRQPERGCHWKASLGGCHDHPTPYPRCLPARSNRSLAPSSPL
jgi:hypothetical protein